MSRFRRIGAGLATAAVLLYGGLIGWLRWNEAGFVFQPDAYGGRTQVPVADSLGLTPERLRLRSTDGAELTTWVMRSADSTGPWLLTCHGNAGNITLLARQRFYRDALAAGLNIVAFDYRGFGSSSAMVPTEQGLYDDATAAYRYLADSLRIPADRIVIYGHSLGGGVAAHLASRVPAAGLILEGTFTSLPDIGQGRYPIVPIRLLMRNRFDNANAIRDLKMPLLVMHARGDLTIPFESGKRLFAMATGPKRFVDLAGDHGTAWEVDHEKYMEAFAGFARGVVGRPAPARPNVMRSRDDSIR